MTYHIFCTFLNLTLISRDEFISKFNLDELKSDPISLYELVLAMTPQLLFQYIRVFIANDEVRFLERERAFEIVDLTGGGEQTSGRIDGRNFDRFPGERGLDSGAEETGRQAGQVQKRTRAEIDGKDP